MFYCTLTIIIISTTTTITATMFDYFSYVVYRDRGFSEWVLWLAFGVIERRREKGGNKVTWNGGKNELIRLWWWFVSTLKHSSGDLAMLITLVLQLLDNVTNMPVINKGAQNVLQLRLGFTTPRIRNLGKKTKKITNV